MCTLIIVNTPSDVPSTLPAPLPCKSPLPTRQFVFCFCSFVYRDPLSLSRIVCMTTDLELSLAAQWTLQGHATIEDNDCLHPRIYW